MTITGVRYNHTTYYQETVSKSDAGQETFIMGNQEGDTEGSENGCGEVPEQFAGMSFSDLMNCSEGRKNQIPLVNQIVSTRNPEDGEIYRAFFTDEKITCNYADGRRAWEIDIVDGQQAGKVKEFFEKYEPVHDWVKEYYSGDNMGMAVVKSFWLDLFGKNGV